MFWNSPNSWQLKRTTAEHFSRDMSLGISTFHFTKWVALHLAELKSNHRIKIEKNHDISDTLVVKGGGDPFTTYTRKRTVTTSLIHSDQWSVHILQKKNKWQVKWSFLHLKNEKSTNSKSHPWQLSWFVRLLQSFPATFKI